MTPIALYIHLPWCVQKCPYCDFNSHEITDKFQEFEYIEALLLDIEQSKIGKSRDISSIFLGGGTPSLFSGDAISTLMRGVNSLLKVQKNCEITMEANPNSLSFDELQKYRQSGINRLSIGAQSFSDEKLQKLGRVHCADEIITVFGEARKAGFENINLDIMFGLSEQSLDEAMLDLRWAIKLNPEHISWYQFTIEPNTAFFQNPPTLPQHDDLFEIQQSGTELLKRYGFFRYEISAFSQNKPCLHNLNYWQFGDYLGVGAGAHGKITDKNGIVRTTKYRNPKQYLSENHKTNSTQKILSADISFEFMLNALRLKQGFSFDLYERQTGLKITDIMPMINLAMEKKWLKKTSDGVKPTVTGFNFLNDLSGLFLI